MNFFYKCLLYGLEKKPWTERTYFKIKKMNKRSATFILDNRVIRKIGFKNACLKKDMK